MVITPHLLEREEVVLFRKFSTGLPDVGQTQSTVSKMTFGPAPRCQLCTGSEKIPSSIIIVNPTCQINNPHLGHHIYFAVSNKLLSGCHNNSSLTLVPSKDAFIFTQVYGERRETLIDGVRR